MRKAEEERMRQEAKEATLRAAKERLDRLQATWKEDQQLREVGLPSRPCRSSTACICTQPHIASACLCMPLLHSVS